MLVTGGQITEVLSEYHTQAMKAATSEEEHLSLSAYVPHSWPLWPHTLHGSRATLRPVSRLRLYSSNPITHLTGTMEQTWHDSKPSAEVNRYPRGSHLRPADPNSGSTDRLMEGLQTPTFESPFGEVVQSFYQIFKSICNPKEVTPTLRKG